MRNLNAQICILRRGVPYYKYGGTLLSRNLFLCVSVLQRQESPFTGGVSYATPVDLFAFVNCGNIGIAGMETFRCIVRGLRRMFCVYVAVDIGNVKNHPLEVPT